MYFVFQCVFIGAIYVLMRTLKLKREIFDLDQKQHKT